ncbi:hypothetical protein [Flavobacterium sp. ov086]|uniref:hypothetical protein n=1 Tax=Flavobacterium sp. ov086 TaxID=1761785 RepID=UPI000B68DDA0|nr:hypothetical protein [Flavobacterium sp. ov086]SNR76310.1 Antibiotic biosynthesis monooxygenase (ABM) superfamily enzyme [Flavobacterium sp. ov086]
MNAILMVHYKISTNDSDTFEIWKEKMDSVIRSFNGYLSTTVLYPINNNDHHYIILRFDSREKAQQWMQSDFRRIMLEDSDTTWMTEKEEVVQQWNNFWYSNFKEVKKWKQWTITFIAVYPITLIMPILVQYLSFFWEGIVTAVLISGCMNFILMPYIVKAFKNWLSN